MIAALSLLVLLAAAADPAAPGAPSGAAGTEPGKLAGKVTVAGLAPKLANLPVTRDMKLCGTSKPEEALEVGTGGGVRNAVVWIVETIPGRPPPEKVKVRLDQQGCAYLPHVVAAPLGATLEIVNSDSLLHNVRATEGSTRIFNYAMPIKGYVIPSKLRKAGLLKVTCDVHPWMHAWVSVLPANAYAVTDAEGNYQIDGLPPGKYTVKLWQERLGEREDHVEIVAAQTAKLDVALSPR